MTDKHNSDLRPTIVLASASPRRAELLASAGIRFSIRPADIDETQLPGETPAHYVERLAREKAAAVAAIEPEAQLVLGSDTTVVIDGEIAGKPADPEDAAQMLRRIAGRWHEVLTGVALVRGRDVLSDVVSTRVRFAPMSEKEIEWYAASGEPDDKAGAYAIQGIASLFVERIEGNYSNVVGLPVAAVYRLAREMGVDLVVSAGKRRKC
jgi:septum formation protein